MQQILYEAGGQETRWKCHPAPPLWGRGRLPLSREVSGVDKLRAIAFRGDGCWSGVPCELKVDGLYGSEVACK